MLCTDTRSPHVCQPTHPPLHPPTTTDWQISLWGFTTHNCHNPESPKRLHTYKTVEHGAGHPSCEAHVEERQGGVWMTRSLWSSSTSSARGAGVTILLLAGASPPLVHSTPFCLLPGHTTSCTFPFFKRCVETTAWSRLPLRKILRGPSRRPGEEPGLGRAPVTLLRGRIVRMRAAVLAVSGCTAKKKS